MQLLDQHSKNIMEGCKERARNAGLRFEDQTLEYIVSNRDLLELSAKAMIPALYDYWVHDVEVLREKGRYELYPSNPYETVINTRPVISFYNDNNPDWLNVMIFYHVLAHIDFFQNNLFFEHTWADDFNGEALADKRCIARLRSKHGRWVDYVIEFSRGIDNLVGYYQQLATIDRPPRTALDKQIDYYFDHFLQDERKVSQTEYLKEIDTLNAHQREQGEVGVLAFFAGIKRRYPEFDDKYKEWSEKDLHTGVDLLQFLLANSQVLNSSENQWMKSVLEIVRKTSLFFQPQIRTKIMNEGWATFWHERLFLDDDRIKGHETDFSRTHSQVASLNRVGLNPYALGLRLFQEIEAWAESGRYSYAFERMQDIGRRQNFQAPGAKGVDYLFSVRRHLCDSLFLRTFITQEFVDTHRLFVAGKRLNKATRNWEYFVQSRKAEDYKKMLLDSLYHPPKITYRVKRTGELHLEHVFEGRPLVADYIANTMLGIEYLWGQPVTLNTHAVKQIKHTADKEPEISWEKIRYTMRSRTLSKERIG